VTGWWFSQGTPVSFTNKIDCHNITEILLKVPFNTINLTLIDILWWFEYLMKLILLTSDIFNIYIVGK